MTVISGVDQRGALHSTCKSEKVTEGIMASLRHLTCLFLLTVSLTDLSKAACRDEFTQSAWKKGHLPNSISIQMDRKAEDVMKCSINNNTKANNALADCFNDPGHCEGESSNSISVPFYHLMCLTDIAMSLTEEDSKAIAVGVCKVYEKVCKPFLGPSSTPDQSIGDRASNETYIFKLHLLIAFLVITNVLVPLAVYMHVRCQRNKESFNDKSRNMLDNMQMTIQPETVVQTEDNVEGAGLLKTPWCSVIINPPDTTHTEILCQNELEH